MVGSSEDAVLVRVCGAGGDGPEEASIRVLRGDNHRWSRCKLAAVFVSGVSILGFAFLLGFRTGGWQQWGGPLLAPPGWVAAALLEFELPAPRQEDRVLVQIHLPKPILIQPAGPSHQGELLTLDLRDGRIHITHSFLGCFWRSANDPQDNPKFLDAACIRKDAGSPEEPCRSGLPFYRKLMQDGQSYLDCLDFCLSKGLDIFGILVAPQQYKTLGVMEECRCGASPENRPVWKSVEPPKSKLPNKAHIVNLQDPRCAVMIWRYTGPVEEAGGVPVALLQLSLADEGYTDTIAVGHNSMGTEEDLPREHPAQLVQLPALGAQGRRLGLCADAEDTGFRIGSVAASCWALKVFCNDWSGSGDHIRTVCPLTCGVCSAPGAWMPCYPYQCAGGGPWHTKEADGKVYIRFYFCENIDEPRKEVVRMAAMEWQAHSCVRFLEQAADSPLPRLKVCIRSLDSCDATVGYPGDRGEGLLNPGWCDSARHVGSMMHELGHVIGMNHEQNRPDATSSFVVPEGHKGPFIRVYWQNIDPKWISEYTPDGTSYVGSNDQGGHDPFSGYAGYDFESIMHYSRWSPGRSTFAFEALNPLFNDIVGQRGDISEGDMRQVADMYQCSSGAEQTPTATQAPAATLAPTPGPVQTPVPTPLPTPPPVTGGGGICEDSVPAGWVCNGRECSCTEVRGYCDHLQYGSAVKAFCPRTCQTCGCSDTPPESWDCNGQPCTCSALQRFCNDPVYGQQLSAHCQWTCGRCGAAAAAGRWGRWVRWLSPARGGALRARPGGGSTLAVAAAFGCWAAAAGFSWAQC